MFTLRLLRRDTRFTQFSNFLSVTHSAHGLESLYLWRLGLIFDWQLAGYRAQVQSHSVSALCHQCSVSLSPPHPLLRTEILSDPFPLEHWSPDNRKAGLPPLTLSQLTHHWRAIMVALFALWRFILIHAWCHLSLWKKVFSSLLKSTNIYYVD